MDGNFAGDDGHGDRGDVPNGSAFAGVDHVGVLVRDIAGATAFYRDRLEARVIAEQTLEEAGVHLAYVDAGTTLIQLVQPLRPGVLMDDLEQRGEGIHHLCLAVEDIPRALTRLAPGAEVPIIVGGRGRRSCFLPDRPHGLRIELTELTPWAERQAADRDLAAIGREEG